MSLLQFIYYRRRASLAEQPQEELDEYRLRERQAGARYRSKHRGRLASRQVDRRAMYVGIVPSLIFISHAPSTTVGRMLRSMALLDGLSIATKCAIARPAGRTNASARTERLVGTNGACASPAPTPALIPNLNQRQGQTSTPPTALAAGASPAPTAAPIPNLKQRQSQTLTPPTTLHRRIPRHAHTMNK